MVQGINPVGLAGYLLDSLLRGLRPAQVRKALLDKAMI
jgi:hypothetical protein